MDEFGFSDDPTLEVMPLTRFAKHEGERNETQRDKRNKRNGNSNLV